MKVNLSCPKMEDYIIVRIGCYDFCSNKPCEKEDNKEYEYEYKNDKIKQYKWKNNVQSLTELIGKILIIHIKQKIYIILLSLEEILQLI